MSKRSGAVGVCAIVCLALAPPAVTAPRQALRLLWSDQAQILQHHLLPRGYHTMAQEVTAIFDAAGIAVSWRAWTEDVTADGSEEQVLVVLIPKTATDWGLPRGTLGAVMGRRGPLPCVYVFYPAVARALAMGRPRSSRDYHVLGRAIGRIAAHEIVHALTPDEPHTTDGLMQAKLTRESLLAGEILLSPASESALASHPTLDQNR